MELIGSGDVWVAARLARGAGLKALGTAVCVFMGLPASAEPIAWTQAVKVSIAGSRITKTGAAGWNAGATSTKALAAGDGFVQYKVASDDLRAIFGLGRTNKNEAIADVDHAVMTAVDGTLHVYESGVDRGAFGAYAAGDVLRVGIEGGSVRYYRNGTAFYTSTVAPRYPLSADVSLYDPGVGIGDAAISGTLVRVANVVWRDCVGTSQCLGTQTGANSLAKAATTNAWDSGAVSTQTISSGDGFVEFSAGQTTHTILCGLGNGNTDAGKADIEFGFRADASGNLSTVEDGVQMGVNIGTYTPGDRLRVTVENGVVKYGKNGVRLYASSKAPTYPLRIDTSFLHAGGTLKDVVIGGTSLEDVRSEDVSWTDVLNAVATDNTLAKSGTAGWNAGAVSTRSFSSDGFVEFTADATDATALVGLSRGDAGTAGAAIDFAIQLFDQGARFTVYQSGRWIGTNFGPYAAGDRFRVEVAGTTVRYRRNGNVFYTNAATPLYPLRADAALWSPNAAVRNVVLGWTVPVATATPRPTPTSGPTVTPPTATPTSTGPSCESLCGIAAGTCHQGCSTSQPCHATCEAQYAMCVASCPASTWTPTPPPATQTPTPRPTTPSPTPVLSCETQCGVASGTCHQGCSTSQPCHAACTAQYEMCLMMCVPPPTATPTTPPGGELPDAALVGPYTFPYGMRRGEVHAVSITMRNSGRPWTRDYKLQVISGTLLPVGVRYDLPPGVTEVPNGGSATFSFSVSPNVQPSGVIEGSISFQMVHVGVGGFGHTVDIQDVWLGDPVRPPVIAIDRASGPSGTTIIVRRTDPGSAALLPIEAGGRFQFSFGDPLASPHSVVSRESEWQSYDAIQFTVPPSSSCGTHYVSVESVGISNAVPFEVVAPCDDTRRNTFDLMAYNVQLKPDSGCGGLIEAIAPFPIPDLCVKGFRVPRIVDHPELQDHDVIVFSESFTDNHTDDLKAGFMQTAREQYPYVTKLGNRGGRISDGGVLILSKWPLTATAAHYYGTCNGLIDGANDCLANKGASYVQVNKAGRRYHVFGTHVDAGQGDGDREARRVQFGQLGSFISQTMIHQGNFGSEPVLIAGDLNVDKNEAEYEGGQAEYLRMISTPYLNAHPITDDDVLRSAIDSYPVSTNRGGQWLDYVLLGRNYLQPIDTAEPRLRVVQPMTDISSWSSPFPYQFDYPYPVPGGLGPAYINKGDLSDHFAVTGRFYFPFE